MQSEKIYELTLKRKLLQFNFEGLLKLENKVRIKASAFILLKVNWI